MTDAPAGQPSPSTEAPTRPADAAGVPPADASDSRAAGTTPDSGSDSAPDETPPASDPATDSDPAAAPGLRGQIGRTKSAFTHLIGSHVELAKAEIADLMDEVKRMAALIGIAIAAFLLAGLLLAIGLPLFIGDALFGSMGWGILHGLLLLTALAVAMIVLALRVRGGVIRRSLLVGIVVGGVVGAVLGLDLTNRAWTALGDQVAGNVSADIRPLVVGAGVLAALGALLGLLLGARSGGAKGAVAGLIGGAILGALLGALTAVALGPRVGAAIGVTVGLLTWLALMGRGVASEGIDGEELKNRFWPRTTIETTKETIEWVREQTPLGPKS